MFANNRLNSFFVLIFFILFSFVSLNHLITDECLQCICSANTGCKPSNKCYEDSLGNVRCGIYLLKKSQWFKVKNIQKDYLNDQKFLDENLDVFFNKNVSFENSFESCFQKIKCSQNVLLAFVNLNLIDWNQNNEDLKCSDIAILTQLETNNHSKIENGLNENRDNFDLIENYKKILKSYTCMNKILPKIYKPIKNTTKNSLKDSNKELFKVSLKRVYSTGLLKNNNNNLKIDLMKKNHTQIDISLVPSRCFSCIRDANLYQKKNNQFECTHPLQKCGPYAINFEYFLEANGNLIVKNRLPDLYNSKSELENKDYFLDLLDFLNKNFNNEEKNLRKESNMKESIIKKDYNDKKLTKLIYHDDSLKDLDDEIEDKIKKNRRNSKFSKNLENYLEEIENKNYPNLNQLSNLIRNDLNFKKMMNSASFFNFAICTLDLYCAESLINAYVSQHLLDCNLDSNIDCDDFAGIHWLGKRCKQNTMLYSNVWKNFEYCLILADNVRKETIPNTRIENTESNNLNHKHNYLNLNELPPFIIRPLSFNLPTNTFSDISVPPSTHENYFGFVNSNFNQYYSSHIVDLSADCLQCICEASNGQNCSKLTIAPGPFSFYFSAYKLAQEGPFSPPPPQAIYHKQVIRRSKNFDRKNIFEHYSSKIKNLNRLRRKLNKRSIKSSLIENNFNYDQKLKLRLNLFKDHTNNDYEINYEVKLCENENQGCGPFGLTKQNWIEAGAPMYRGAANDFDRCAESNECSIETISKFVTRFSMDCTKDGRLSCADFGLIHKFKEKCADLNVLNTEYYRKFEKCQLKLNLH